MIALNQFKQLINALISVVAFFSLIYFIFLYYSIGDRPWLFYNSDSVYLPYLYGDLVFRHGTISQWLFSPVPYFFPDTFLYFIIATVAHDLRWAILMVACVQFALYYVLIVAIGNEVTGSSKKGAVFHLSVFVSLALVAAGYLQQETLNLGLITQTHFSTALMFLLGLFLILKTFSSHKKIYYYLLFMVCFFTTFSDVLFVTQFVGVTLISLCFMLFVSHHEEYERKKIYAANIFVITIATSLSYVIYQHSFFFLNMTFGMNLVKRYGVADLILAGEKIYQNMMMFYQENPVVGFLFLLFLVFCLLFIAKIIYDRVKQRHVLRENKFVFTITMLFVSIITCVACLLVLDNNLMVLGYHGLRHCLPMIIFPVFLGIPLLLIQYTRLNVFLAKYYACFVAAIVTCTYFLAAPGSVANIVKFYPPSVACLDGIAKKYDLKDGVTDFYWVSRSYSFLSKRELNIAVVAGLSKKGFVPRRWFNTINDYVAKDFRYYVSNVGHLVDTDHYQPIDNAHIQKKIGPASAKFICPSWEAGKSDYIYVYKKNKINIDFDYKEKA